MVSVERLFGVQVLLDVIVQALFPVGVGDFYNTIYKTKGNIFIWYLITQKSVDQGRKFNAGVFLDVAEWFVAYSCGVRVVHCRQVSVKRGAGARARAASWSIFF